MIPEWVKVLARVIKGILNALNQKKQQDYVDKPADALANGGRVQQSDKSFAELASESERDSTE